LPLDFKPCGFFPLANWTSKIQIVTARQNARIEAMRNKARDTEFQIHYISKMKPLLALLLFQVVLHEASSQATDTTKVIDALFSSWNNATPGGAIAISKNNKIIYNKAFGLADLEHNVPNTTSTIFESGSVAKQFTAMSILLLESEKKLSLKDDVRKYVPELPTYQAPITIQHLLNHTSGLKDWGSIGEIEGWPRTTRVYTLDLALEIMCRQKTLNFKPGTEYSYSNSNYSLLVIIVERVSKQTLAEFTKARLFEPAGMSNTKWRDNFREVLPNRAIAYSRAGRSYQQLMPFENVHGHGGLLTNTGDLLKWNQLLETHSIGGDVIYAKRVERGKLNNGKPISYAAGLFLGRVNGYDEIQHSGATAGYRAWLAYYPAKKLSVVMLSNDAQFNMGAALRSILDTFLGKEIEKSRQPRLAVTLSGPDLDKWPGVYRSIRGFDVIRLEKKGDEIVVNGRALKASHRDTLFFENMRWISTRPGEILVQSSDTTRYTRMVTVTGPFNLNAYAGKYHSSEANADYSIDVKDNELWVKVKPALSFKLTPLFQHGFQAPSGELFEFRLNKQGITGFDLSASRALYVPFTKTKQP
jgi:CubicO group peptidase (beta-lactamase class C family)